MWERIFVWENASGLDCIELGWDVWWGAMGQGREYLCLQALKHFVSSA